jgi:hypothetical protein
MACGDRNAGQQRAQSRRLVRWIDVGMQEDDSDRFDAGRRNRIRDGSTEAMESGTRTPTLASTRSTTSKRRCRGTNGSGGVE